MVLVVTLWLISVSCVYQQYYTKPQQHYCTKSAVMG